MPRPRLPPTPSSSTDIVGREKQLGSDMEGVFALPPPAVESTSPKVTQKPQSRSTATSKGSPLSSPLDQSVGEGLQRKRTLSGNRKPKLDHLSATTQSVDTALPPPPSRARKIIQMKPKQQSKATDMEKTQAVEEPSPVRKGLASPSTPTTKRKQTQSSTTSAAGRKIARKTAHSIIERRRRNKMNEEFGVLKNMIPACAGVEMHKLAILQAGIEYVRYLEGCVEKLKRQNGKLQSDQSVQAQSDLDEDESMSVDSTVLGIAEKPPPSASFGGSDTSSSNMVTSLPGVQFQRPLPPFRNSSPSTESPSSTQASPDLRPTESSSSVSTASYRLHCPATQQPKHATRHPMNYSVSPPPLSAQTPLQTGVSPAFGAFNFGADPNVTSTWATVNGQMQYNKPSPNILPLPQAAVPLPLPLPTSVNGFGISQFDQYSTASSEGQAEATATAALIMMTKDHRRNNQTQKNSSSKGMSVRDLLSS